MKGRLLAFFGYIALFAGIFFFSVGIGMHFDRSDERHTQGIPIAIFSFAFTAPGALMIWLGRKARKDRERIESLASIVKSYRRITLADLAEKLFIPIPVAGRLLTTAIAIGLVKGKFDRTTNEFFTEDAREKRLEIKFCASCGAPLDRVYLEGDTVRCTTCGVLMR